MYTGIVETTGTIVDVEEREGGRRVRIRTDADGIEPADSVSVDGVCLTAEAVGDDWFEAYCSGETVARTTLGERSPGEPVNVERPLAAGGRFDGHVVRGCVDATTEVRAIDDRGDDRRFAFDIPDGYAPYVAEKGGVAVDGVSLTVAAVTGDAFEVAVVPATYRATTLAERSVGDTCNFEADALARYVVRREQLAARSS